MRGALLTVCSFSSDLTEADESLRILLLRLEHPVCTLQLPFFSEYWSELACGWDHSVVVENMLGRALKV